MARIDLSVLGERIKRARQALHLTQGELAAEIASVAYVSRIESGQRRPDGKLLVRLAERLGVPLDVLLAPDEAPESSTDRLEVDYAELALESGEPEEALARSAALLRQSRPLEAELERRVRFVRARSLEVLGRLDEAIVELEDLVQSERDDLLWVGAAIALSRCYRQSGDYARAITSGERALAMVATGGLHGCDEEVQLAVTVAAAHHDKGDTGHAVRLCQRAIADAESRGSTVARASAYWNASVFAAEKGDTATALPMAEKALALFGEGRDARNLARLRSLAGILHLRMDPPQVLEALPLLTRAGEELRGSSASLIDVARNDLALGRASFLDGSVDHARELAQGAVEVAVTAAPTIAAEGHALLGQIALTRGERAMAVEHYATAVTLLTGAGADREAAALWFELAGEFEALGDDAAALDAYRRAAVSTGLPARASTRTLQH